MAPGSRSTRARATAAARAHSKPSDTYSNGLLSAPVWTLAPKTSKGQCEGDGGPQARAHHRAKCHACCMWEV